MHKIVLSSIKKKKKIPTRGRVSGAIVCTRKITNIQRKWNQYIFPFLRSSIKDRGMRIEIKKNGDVFGDAKELYYPRTP
jgi:Zn/Cd-binding protein ZinT